MSSSALILCVDDEPINLAIMEELLQDRYELNTTESGKGCLQKVEAQKPDLILLDVNMPDIDGLEICRRLKADHETADIPIIFISALASHAELMAGYEAGGDDYITKPFSEEILRKKIDVVLASQRRKQELKKISEKAVEDLMENLSTAEQLGIVVQFLSQSQVHGNLDELVRHVFECLRRLDLDSSLLVIDDPENRVWFGDEIDRPMERQILESLHGQDSVVSFGTRLAINASNATLLVRNLPDDADKVRRVREYLTILIEGFDIRIQGLRSEKLLARRRELIQRVLDAARETLGSVKDMRRQQKARSEEILSAMSAEFDVALAELDLTRKQETGLQKIVESTKQEFESVYGDGDIDRCFREIIEQLSQALDEHR